MHTASWRLQDAKNQFSKVVDAALHGEPQRVTRGGRDAVPVVFYTATIKSLNKARTKAAYGIAHRSTELATLVISALVR